MKIPPSKARTIHWVLVYTLLLSLLTGCASTSDVSNPTRTQLGTIPASHPERGLGSLQGYLDKQAVLDSIALLPPPPLPDSAAFAHDGEVARSTFALRGTPRFELAVTDYDLKIPSLVNTFSCALNAQITEANAPYLYTVLRRSVSDLGASTSAAKEHYNRLRPFQLNHEPIGVPEARAFLEKKPRLSIGTHCHRLGVCAHLKRDCARSGQRTTGPWPCFWGEPHYRQPSLV